MAPGKGALRLTRVAIFALAAVGLAAAAHVAGGESVSPMVAVLAVALVMLVMNPFAGRRRGRISLLLSMGLTQAGLHLTFMAASIARDCQPVGGQPMASMSRLAPAAPAAEATGAVGVAGGRPLAFQCGSAMTHAGANGDLRPAAGMLLVHALAAVLMVVLLTHGEAAVWALAAGLRFQCFLLGSAPPLPPACRLPVAATDSYRPGSTVSPCAPWRRRGPPRTAFAVL